MEKELRYSRFAVDKKIHISSEDLTNFREFYGPILGGNPIFFYEYLLDFAKGTSYAKSSFDYKVLALFLNMDLPTLNLSRTQLEALGLINTYYDNQQGITIFQIQKPLDADKIKNNKYISDLLISRIGKTNFDEMIKLKAKKFSQLIGDDYEYAGANFFEVFDVPKTSEKTKSLDQIFIEIGQSAKTKAEVAQFAKHNVMKMTLDLVPKSYSNEYEAILKLNPVEFYKQIWLDEPSEHDLQYLVDWNKDIRDGKILNLIMYLNFISRKSKYKSTDSWLKKCTTQINEITQKGLSDFETVEQFLDGKFSFTKDFRAAYEQKTFLKQNYLEQLNSK